MFEIFLLIPHCDGLFGTAVASAQCFKKGREQEKIRLHRKDIHFDSPNLSSMNGH